MGEILAICGSGSGKTSDAVGYAVKYASMGKDVIVVQFLKGSDTYDYSALSQIEPQIKWLSFERSGKLYEELSDEEKSERKSNVENALHYAKKVVQTHECDMLILDECLGIVDTGIIDSSEVIEFLKFAKDTDILTILTGRNLPDEIKELADHISRIETIK